jgi:hypothetical protein
MKAMFNSSVAVSMQEDKAKLREILANNEYKPNQEGGFNLLDEIGKGLKYLFNQIAKLFPEKFLPNSSAAIHIISYLVIAGGLCLLGYLIYWLIRQLTVQRRFTKGLQLSAQELMLSYHDYMQNARQAAEAANWKDGARYLFLALLFYCDKNAWIRIEKWKTNGEYLIELQAAQPAIVQEFVSGALLFDKIWYGKTSIDAAEFQAVYRKIEPIVKEGNFDV